MSSKEVIRTTVSLHPEKIMILPLPFTITENCLLIFSRKIRILICTLDLMQNF